MTQFYSCGNSRKIILPSSLNIIGKKYPSVSTILNKSKIFFFEKLSSKDHPTFSSCPSFFKIFSQQKNVLGKGVQADYFFNLSYIFIPSQLGSQNSLFQIPQNRNIRSGFTREINLAVRISCKFGSRQLPICRYVVSDLSP